ncbi:hypothetical protein DFH09DRAFT_1307550 [Mycena vulgaris]|nr:hypothetical protein DFH09DRAFT_1307550 [Mycena vulgaris]
MSRTAGTLRSGHEYALHGAIVLTNFDVLDHLQASRLKNNDPESATDDAPISIPAATVAAPERTLPRRARSLSPVCRSARLVSQASEAPPGHTRASQCAVEQAAMGTSLKRVVRKHVANAQPIPIAVNPADYPVTSTGWSRIWDKPCEQREYSLEQLQRDFAMTVIPWDGQSPRPLVNKGGRVIAVLGGHPKGQLKFRVDQVNGRRGVFSSVSYGILYGGGQQVLGNLAHPSPMCQVLERLFSLACFFCIAGFANGLFKTWNPAVHTFYTLTLDALTFDYNPSLRRNFLRQYSSFAAATLNFGPTTVTFPHIDALNLAWGWCLITALGQFDPNQGGHLVL